MARLIRLPLIFAGLFLSLNVLPAAGSEPVNGHFFNDPANLHEDPNYQPGDYQLPEVFAGKNQYFLDKAELIAARDPILGTQRLTLGTGEIRFTTLKNQSAKVTGYFRNYIGVLDLGIDEPNRMTLLIDVNSMDTAVPGRNNRILAIFFESMKPENAVIKVEFDEIDLGGRNLEDVVDGEELQVQARGQVTMNQVSQPLTAALSVVRQGMTWRVQTVEPVMIAISDFSFDERVDALLEACNHRALGDAVEVEVELYLR